MASPEASLARSGSEKVSHDTEKVLSHLYYGGTGGGVTKLAITFPSSGLVRGQTLAKHDAASPPSVAFHGPPGHAFTLLCCDPDAPRPESPSNRSWLHWAVANVPADGDIRKGVGLVPYVGPSPPAGIHRYAFLLYQQPQGASLPVSDAPGSRAKFDARAFARTHGLTPAAPVEFFTCAAEQPHQPRQPQR